MNSHIHEEKKTPKWPKVLAAVAAVVFLWMFIKVYSLSSEIEFLEERDSSLIEEIGELKGESVDLGLDTEEEEQEDSDSNEDDLQLAMFKYVDYLAKKTQIAELVDLNKTMLEQLPLSEVMEEYTFSEVNEDEDGMWVNVYSEESMIASFKLDYADGQMSMKTVLGSEEINEETFWDLEAYAKDFLDEYGETIVEIAVQFEGLKEETVAAINSEEVAEALANQEIYFGDEAVEEDGRVKYQVFNYSEDLIGEVVIFSEDGEIWLEDLRNPDYSLQVTDIATALAPFLAKLDARTLIEKKVEEALARVEATLNDKGFQIVLSESGIEVSKKFREDDQRYYFDIFSTSGVQLSAIVVEKTTGVVNIVEPDGTNSENILFFNPEFKKKTLELPENIPDYGEETISDDGTFNILIAGKHGNLVDTMIFAHLDKEEGTARLVSIPRDLHYNGRKINSFPYYYGMPELKKVLSDMTGYELDKYILIDMYAFIDVIDLIGGIDITLESPVVDPYYRTVDNGVVGTLNYEPGDYHLGGKEALRLARSRKTSSDFARAERQQKILEAIQDKAQNFGFGDADTMYEIVRSVLAKTETDIEFDEAISYFLEFRDYKVASNNVMSSGNVLYAPPYVTQADCDAQVAAASEEGAGTPSCVGGNHAYILIPRNEDWNLIKWFFKQNFEGEFDAA